MLDPTMTTDSPSDPVEPAPAAQADDGGDGPLEPVPYDPPSTSSPDSPPSRSSRRSRAAPAATYRGHRRRSRPGRAHRRDPAHPQGVVPRRSSRSPWPSASGSCARPCATPTSGAPRPSARRLVGMLWAAYVHGPAGLVVAWSPDVPRRRALARRRPPRRRRARRPRWHLHRDLPDLPRRLRHAAARARGRRGRIFVFLITTVCSDVGGYAAGVLFGKHPMAPTISPKKSWEGFAGSVLLCVVGGSLRPLPARPRVGDRGRPRRRRGRRRDGR